MYGTSLDMYLVHQHNEDLLREVRTARLEGRLRAGYRRRNARHAGRAIEPGKLRNIPEKSPI